MTGWGSLLPYVEERLEAFVHQLDSSLHFGRLDLRSYSVVAQGNYMALQYNLGTTKHLARSAYAVVDLKGSIRLIVNENDDLTKTASEELGFTSV